MIEEEKFMTIPFLLQGPWSINWSGEVQQKKQNKINKEMVMRFGIEIKLLKKELKVRRKFEWLHINIEGIYE